jgi:diaminopimelate decarboxylase
MFNYRDRQLTIENIGLDEVVDQRSTPFYIYSWDKIVENISVVKDVFKGIDHHISFAAKSNNNLNLLRELKNQGLGIDVVSEGELMAAELIGFNNKDIIVNGNGKTNSFLEQLVSFEPMAINIDSKDELERLEKICNRLQKSVVVALRVNPDVDPLTHPYISTGLKQNKFGMEMEIARELIEKYHNHVYIKVKGLHVHIGSQLLKIEPYMDAFTKIKEFVDSLQCHDFEFLNIGGGWGIDYQRDGQGFPVNRYVNYVLPILKSFNLKIILELGRFIVGNSGALIGRVEYIKRTPYKNFVVTDASMASLLRPTLYSSYHHIYNQYESEDKIVADVVGPLCESGDKIASDRMLDLPKEQECIAVCDAGAYGFSMSSNYNFSIRPAEYLIKDGKIVLIRPRENISNLTSYFNAV